MQQREPVGAGGNAAASGVWAFVARAFKSVVFWIIMACAVMVFLVAGYLYDDLALELKVNSFNNSVAIKNIGVKPTKILDLDINNSDDCTLFKNWGDNQFNPGNEDGKRDLHKFFVYKGFRQFKGLTGLLEQYQEIVHSQTPIILDIGDSDIWGATCSPNIVRVTVTTERGSATFSFRPPY